jgi:hypothetical protein
MPETTTTDDTAHGPDLAALTAALDAAEGDDAKRVLARDIAEQWTGRLTPRERIELRDLLYASGKLAKVDFGKLCPSGRRLAVAEEADPAEIESAVNMIPLPGTRGVLFDPAGERLMERKGGMLVFLDWAPKLLAWWPGPDGLTVYRVSVHGQTEDILSDRLRDGTAWDLFDWAAGQDVRAVREALAGCVKVQRRELPPVPGVATLGWHEVDGEPVYASGGICFGPSGEVPMTMSVPDADDASLPSAPTGGRLREVAALSLSILDTADLRVSAPGLCVVWLAPLVSLFPKSFVPRFVFWLWSNGAAGVFGVLKSSFAAVLQAHSGAGFLSEADLVPAADCTAPSLSALLGVRKDGLVVIDDYKPGETSTVANKTQGTAEQGIRMATNRQRRKIRRYGAPGLANTLSCMALLAYTAETLPMFDSGSTHDRTYPVLVESGSIRPKRLADVQGRVEDLPEAGAGYAAWLAAHHDEVVKALAERFPQLRDELKADGRVKGRACSHIAHLLCAAEIGTRFSVDAGALTEAARTELLAAVRDALIGNSAATLAERAEDQPAAVWLDCLRSLFASGRIYAEAQAGGRPAYGDALGWSARDGGTMFPDSRVRAGYAVDGGLAVIESVVNGAVKDLANKAGKSLQIDGVDLRRALAAAGVLTPAEHKDGLHEHQHRHRIGNARPWLPVVPWAVLLGPDEDPAPAESRGQDPADTPPPDRANEPQQTRISVPAAQDPAAEWAAAWLLFAGRGDLAELTAAREDLARQPGAFVDAVLGHIESRPAEGWTLPSSPAQTAATLRDSVRAARAHPAPTPADPIPAPVAEPDRPATPVTAQQRRASFVAGSKVTKRPAARTALAEALVKLDDMAALADPGALTEDEIASLAASLRVLAALEGDGKTHGPFAPYHDKRGPWWQATLPPASNLVKITNWNWRRDGYDGPALVLDRSGAHPSAASSVTVAHGALTHTGPIPELPAGTLAPGYYQVEAQHWHETALPCPLPGIKPGTRVWVPGPRAQLLRDLTTAGRWADGGALDSHTGQPVRLTAWAGYIGDLRRYARAVHGRGNLPDEVVKIAFGQAMGLLNGSWIDDPDDGAARRVWKCKARRMDWKHAVEDQSAVTLWRVADECLTLAPGSGPLALRNMDELVIPAAALPIVTQVRDGRAAVRIDESGIGFGTFKTKTTDTWEG